MAGPRASGAMMKPAVDTPFALELTTTVLVIVGALAVALLVVIVVAPWKQVRREPPLDPDVEAKLLLHRNPDEPTGELPATRVSDLPDPAEEAEDVDVAGDRGYDDLRDL
jgi:hypothetical protein